VTDDESTSVGVCSFVAAGAAGSPAGGGPPSVSIFTATASAGGSAPFSEGFVFRGVLFRVLVAPAALRARRLLAGWISTASRFVFSSVMANSVLLHFGEDVVGNFKVGMHAEDIIAVVESIAEPQHLGGGRCVFDGDGRFWNVG
jgi:hypothetical protein